MSQKAGQKLTNNPKDRRVEIRMDKETIEKLDYLSIKQNSNRSKVIRLGIEKLYNELLTHTKDNELE